MKAVAAYIASKSLQRGGDDRRTDYGGPENRQYSGNQRQPNQYGPRNGMDEHWPRKPGMERGGDSGSRMTYEDNGPESRYRGRDGRWKAGTRRSEYNGGAYDTDPPGRRMGDDYDKDDDVQSNVIPWPYAPGMPHMPPESRTIGFGNRPREYETRSHYDGGRQEAEVGGTMWMQPVEKDHHKEMMELDRKTAEKWVRKMEGEDPTHQTGERWSMDDLKPMAQKMGINPDPDDEEFLEFWVMTNAMYSDYCMVAKKFNIASPEFYGMLAKAWMDDKDAVPNKTAMYYECCVRK